ncbi:hypothetical protein GCM10007971_19310 [Oceanobacillus indicireducens]|uniref:Uncharacterized protein n=1 Tax=Oceanobacillus indicireducens TaxID=1004261 RepID=A0A917XX27_9BACI|nr:hypothetical protein GCM10007971_19310 [Oceanobacillus indicireducens]
MLGLPKGEVYLIPWSEEWEREFELERERIETQGTERLAG